MAGLADVVRAGVAAAHTITQSLQADVSLARYTGQDAFGAVTYAAAADYPALVEYKVRLHETASGKLVQTRAKVTFLTVIPPNGAANRTEPIDSRDRIVLPDGTTGPIVDVEGLVNPDTERPYLVECWISAS